MDIDKILVALRNERNLLEEAIAALERLSGAQKRTARQPAPQISEKISHTAQAPRSAASGFD